MFVGLPSLLMPIDSVSRGTCFRDSIGSSPSLACSTTSSSASAIHQTHQVAPQVAQQNKSALAANRQLQRPICVIITDRAVGQAYRAVVICPRPSLHCRVSPTGHITHLAAPHAPLSQLQHQLGSPAALNKVTSSVCHRLRLERLRHTLQYTMTMHTCWQTQTNTDRHTITHIQQACLPVLDTGDGHSSLTTSTMGHQPSPSMLRAVVGVGAAVSSRA